VCREIQLVISDVEVLFKCCFICHGVTINCHGVFKIMLMELRGIKGAV
jgi:hypothetical protein